MLRLQTETGWWLVTHPDHAALAGDFAVHWGNSLFASPTPHSYVLHAILAHDDGWRTRDAQPLITRAGLPAAFSRELVGRYSAFEEIDLEAYLAVRRNAVQAVAQENPYAAILISMHTFNLLTERADRTTIAAAQLPLLDAFLHEQRTLQQTLRQQLIFNADLPLEQTSLMALTENFRLLQACDNLSLLACTDFPEPATLLHPLLTHDGSHREVQVTRTAERTFCLDPYPLDKQSLIFNLKARFVSGTHFSTHSQFDALFQAAPLQSLSVTIHSS